MNTQERQLSEMLHRVTPEPPRRVTVEDVEARLAQGGAPRRIPRWNRGWAPAVAAASVIAVAAASAGIASALSSRPSATTSHPGNNQGFSSPPSAVSSSAVASASGTPTGPEMPPERVAGGVWGAKLINSRAVAQGSLTGGPSSLYEITPRLLERIDPRTGNLMAMANSLIPDNPDRPAVVANTVWTLSSYSGGSVVLQGYDGKYLQQVGSVTVPVSGQMPGRPAGVLAAGGGYLYVAAGNSVAVVNPGTKRVVKRISVSEGPVSSVAVSPDGSKLYVGAGSAQLITYNTATGVQLGGSGISDLTSAAGNLVATPSGVWGTAGVGMSEWVWFAPDGDLARMVRVTQGTGDGTFSIPTFSGGVVWLGGSHTLACADPDTGQVRASVAIPTDNGVAEHFGSVAVIGGKAYALYQDQASRQAGLAALTPPAACGG